MNATTAQRQSALEHANRKRQVVARVRRDLLTHKLKLRDLLADPPPELLVYPIVDVARLSRSRNCKVAWLSRMGAAAAREGINLFMPLERVSSETREWVATYADWHFKPYRKADR